MNKLICIAGKNRIAVQSLIYLVETLSIDRQYIWALPNSTDMGVDSWQPSLKKCAQRLQCKLCTLDEVQQQDNMLFISLEFDRILKVNSFRSTSIFNIHFSKLPSYKGMYTSVWPILNGESETGVTLHKVDEGIDTGAIIDQFVFKIGINDTAHDLYFKYLDRAFDLFTKNIQDLLSGKYKAVPQSAIGSSYFAKGSIDFKNIQIDYKKTSFEIHNNIRAFIFPEYQVPILEGCPIIKSELTDEFIGRNCLQSTDFGFVVSGIDGYRINLYTKK